MPDNIEQAEKIQALWLKHWSSFLSAILFVICILLGWQWYQNHQKSQNNLAESAFLELMGAVNKNPSLTKGTSKEQLNSYNKLNLYISKLTSNHPNTAYAAAARLILAKQQVTERKFDAAVITLQKIEQQNLNILSQTATLRIARIYLAHKSPNKAQRYLEQSKLFPNKTKNPTYQMILAQSLLQQHQNTQAQEHIKLALASSQNNPTALSWLKLQLGKINTNQK